MRYIKLFFLSVIVLFLVLAGIAALFPRHLRMSRAINMGVSREQAFRQISDLGTWDSWNLFITNAPLTHRRVSVVSQGKGPVLSSDQLTIAVENANPDSVTTIWKQANAKEFSGGFNLLQLQPDSITLQWYFDFNFRWYPWEKLSSLLYERNLGPVMEESLARLKEKLENSK